MNYKKNSLKTLLDVSLVDFKYIKDETGLIIVGEKESEFHFDIKRFFIVSDLYKSVRGNHAHKNCSQLLISLTGSIKVTVNDGINKKDFLLDKSSIGLLIPPMIWANQKYLSTISNLLVLCDDFYDEKDYIRDFNDFIEFRKKNVQ